MDANDLKKRTKLFALRIIKFVQSFLNQPPASVIGRQLLNSGTSVGANYRASCRARSRADFIAKLKIVEEECDESIYWIELLQLSRLADANQALPLIEEARQILSIIVASIRTARGLSR